MSYEVKQHRAFLWGILSLSLIVLMGHASLVSAQAPSFTPTVIDGTVQGDTKAIGDIDGDGFADLVFGSRQLYWYQYPTWTRTLIAVPIDEFTTEMQVGDVDGDGDLDVIVPDGSGADNVLWFENPRPGGNPSVDPWIQHVIGSHGGWAHDIEVGDVNGDGRLDVVTRRDRTMVWLQNTPVSWTGILVNNRGAEGMALGDIDRDGDLDIAINGYWIETPANPLVDPWIEYAIDPGWPGDTRVSMADMNGDGRLDVLLSVSESDDSRIVWYEAPANPVVDPWITHVVEEDVNFVHSLETADMDNDGDPDIVFAEMSQSARDRVGYFENVNGDALTWTLRLVSTIPMHQLRVGDIGGDGDMDLFGADWAFPPLVLWEQTSAPPIVIPPGGGETSASVDPQPVQVANIIQTTNLSITMVADPSFGLPGDSVTWTVTVTNTGTVSAGGVVIEDLLPVDLIPGAVTATAGVVTISGRTIRVDGIALNPGDSLTITIQSQIDPDTGLPFVISNQACVTSAATSAPRCAQAVVVSVTRLPSAGMTPLSQQTLVALLIANCVALLALAGSILWRRSRRQGMA